MSIKNLQFIIRTVKWIGDFPLALFSSLLCLARSFPSYLLYLSGFIPSATFNFVFPILPIIPVDSGNWGHRRDCWPLRRAKQQISYRFLNLISLIKIMAFNLPFNLSVRKKLSLDNSIKREHLFFCISCWKIQSTLGFV